MASTARDRSARSRIREYLAQRGPIDDPSGRATALLKDAIDYQGSSVAFIQLVTAMDKADEITREIRGKRTYKITAAASSAPAVPSGASRISVASGGGARYDIDYDELARAVLREMWRVMGTAELAPTARAGAGDDLDAVRLERDRLMTERDEYLRRLQVARSQLSALIGQALPEGEIAPADAEGARIEQAS